MASFTAVDLMVSHWLPQEDLREHNLPKFAEGGVRNTLDFGVLVRCLKVNPPDGLLGHAGGKELDIRTVIPRNLARK